MGRKPLMGTFGPLHTSMSICNPVFLSTPGMNKYFMGIIEIVLKTLQRFSMESHNLTRQVGLKVIFPTLQVGNKNLKVRQVVICSKVKVSFVVKAEL